MTTVLQPAMDGLPIHFMGGTVISFNASIGFGSQQESSLTIQLIEDCEAPTSGGCVENQTINTSGIIGSPQYFTAGNFTFGGIVTSWNKTRNMSGEIYTIKLTDPRQLLENVTIITDSIRAATEPYRTSRGGSVNFWDNETVYGPNYYNVFAWYEDRFTITNGVGSRCSAFGDSGNIDGQGMPYARVKHALTPRAVSTGTITTLGRPPIGPLGIFPYSMFNSDSYIGTPIKSASDSINTYDFEVDLSTLPEVPDYYRIPGPTTTILQMAQDVCDVTAKDFYVYMEQVKKNGAMKNIIKFGLVDLNSNPSSFDTIVSSFSGQALDLSFGEEFRSDITRSILIGDNMHTLTYANEFLPFFGEDTDPASLKKRPVIAFKFDYNGFWIAKNVDDLNLKLYNPFFVNGGLYSIHELDIRCAMASFKAWFFRTFTGPSQQYPYNGTPGTFNAAIRDRFSSCVINNPEWIRNRLVDSDANLGIIQASLYKSAQDLFQNPKSFSAASNRPDNLIDLEKIHSWLADLGNTYYGKQYITPVQSRLCYRKVTDGSTVFTKEPTNAGAWVDPGSTILDLYDPELDTFRTEDGRIRCFAVFKTDGEVANAGAPGEI